MSLDSYAIAMNREAFGQDLIKRQYAEIAKQSQLSEKRITEILDKVLNDYTQFYLLHSFLDFDKVSKPFFKRMCEIVAQLYYHKKLEITNHILEYQYMFMMLQMLSKRKQIFNDIILNAITDNTLTEDSENIDVEAVIEKAKRDFKNDK